MIHEHIKKTKKKIKKDGVNSNNHIFGIKKKRLTCKVRRIARKV